MSKAVRELVKQARRIAYNEWFTREHPYIAHQLRESVEAATAELNKSPAEQHQERLEEVLEWNR